MPDVLPRNSRRGGKGIILIDNPGQKKGKMQDQELMDVVARSHNSLDCLMDGEPRLER